MARTRLTQSERREQTRQRLLEAAERLFATHGYEATSVDDVAEAAGLSKGALYYNFPSKEDVFLAVVDGRTSATFRMLEEIMEREVTVPEKLGALARVLAAYGPTADASALEIEGWLQAVREPKVRRRLTTGLGRARGMIAELIASQLGGAASKLPLPPEELASAIIALASGLSVLNVLEPASVRPGLFPSLIAILLGADVPSALRDDDVSTRRRGVRS